eukprot:scaffold23131_cov61-Phaeocystis_antarctica.AAC.3
MWRRRREMRRGRVQIHIYAHAIGRMHVCLAVHSRGTGIRVGGDSRVYCAGWSWCRWMCRAMAGRGCVRYVSSESTPLRGQPGWDCEGQQPTHEREFDTSK